MKLPIASLMIALSAAIALPVTAAPGASTPAAIAHVDPPNWWAGMKDQRLQLMVHGRGIGAATPSIRYPGVTLRRVHRVANPNYLFLDLEIAPGARPGSFDIVFSGPVQARHSYRLLAREEGSAARRGFSSRDAIYQVMPDRWANGDPSNDDVQGMLERADRGKGYGRHGGDLAGITTHLDYIAQMGFTQLWPTPLVENNMPAYSYHGYAATDHYRIDPRYGTLDDYVKLSREAKRRGIGIIQDVVLSHIGLNHWWMKDLPTPDWINYGGRFVPTAHHRVAVQDPYGSREDARNFTQGWFTDTMPDLNQANPFVANYLIQNSIWWIEYAGLSGLRIDTYSYSDGAFLTEYGRRIMAEYPQLNMVGEEWHKSPAVVSRWQAGKRNVDGYRSHTPSLMDFPLGEAMRSALSPSGKAQGFNDVYELLSQDYLYPDPGQLVLFEGNHDMARLFSVAGGDYGLWQIGIAYIMTMPRIPQLYYGTEILMTSTTEGRDDASYRHDFPGGWAGDATDAFSGKGLAPQQLAAQAWVRRLATWRRGEKVIHDGRTMHYGAQDGTYVYFRYDDDKTVLVALNRSDREAALPVARFHERMAGVQGGTDVVTGKRHDVSQVLRLAPKSALVLELDRPTP